MIGIDAGNHDTKFYDGTKLCKFPSDIGLDYRERNLTNSLGEDDMVWEYQGKRGFAGTLAKYESECGESRKGDTKAHFDAQLRVLLALHRFANTNECQIVVGQPIGTHTEQQKRKIKEMLQGRHELTVNGVKKIIVVRRCEVAAEGATAGILPAVNGICRVIDIGSGTINYGSLHNLRFIDRDSFTSSYGMSTIRNLQPEALARMVAVKATTKWHEQDRVFLCGGGADTLFHYIREYFPNAELMPNAVFANVKAFYEIARKIYG